MAKGELTELYRVLLESRFRFLGDGVFHLDEIYTTVKKLRPGLCDDSYLCSSNCRGGNDRPEWCHVIRTALTDVKKRHQGVSSGGRRKYWKIGSFSASEVPVVNEEFVEGRLLLVLHKRKERNPKAARRKKQLALATTGRLECEVCGFDFESIYGSLGVGFAECHHRVSLSELSENHRTKLRELAIVCANCHRMLHRRPYYTLERLRSIIAGN
jgi:predicted HNH restriction endonuclease